MTITGNIVDIPNRNIFHGTITIEGKKIVEIEPKEGTSNQYILPGFVDAHIHIESSMLVPSEFARLAVLHGTVATVSDPHEIANVMGIAGVEYMIENGKKVPLKFNFGAPSCVPATTFESAGATIDVAGVTQLLENPDIKYLAEMMNYPGVLFEDPMVMAKLAAAKKLGKPIDGHAPGVSGKDAAKYIAAGISTDHECFTYEEALEKLQHGMKILIREGSAAKNYEALHPLIDEYPDKIMLCSDDKHPDDLIEGHINQLVARALRDGYDLFNILQAACLNPVAHYNLDVGILKIGDAADFILVDNLTDFKVNATYINGKCVMENAVINFPKVTAPIINQFNTSFKSALEFQLKAKPNQTEMRVIQVIDKEIVTESFRTFPKIANDCIIPDLANDILKLTVVNRYQNASPAVAFIRGFTLKNGAIASCVGHDSHNIIAVGTTDEQLAKAVNLIIKNKGGIAAVSGENELVLPLPIAGIMTNADGRMTAEKYATIDQFVKKEMNCGLTAPFMTLSFMALLVIPELKLSDKGLFDGKTFEFVV
ncbi:MAG: adenine deaminase [Saprospiraceae bacterium]